VTAFNQLKAGGRQLACARCGTEFTCNVGGPCWCSEETVRLPLPQAGVASPTGFDDCLCRSCLRAVAAEHIDNRR
jgi:Cysteine-rich CWC